MTAIVQSISPVSDAKRIISLDVLRGFAILGILIINIQSFSMVQAAYLNPTAYGDLTGLNQWIWILSHTLADQKFITIFSILFGAGVVLITSRFEAKNKNVASLHYRRTFWLLIIGLIHAYIFWYGDILVVYSLCAFLLFFFRNVKPYQLLITGLVLISITSLISLFLGLSISFWPPEAVEGNMMSWKPDFEIIERELAAYRGSWLEQMSNRVPAAAMMHTAIFVFYLFWRVFGVMLIGMALFKWGVLTAERSKQFYKRLMLAGLCSGLPLVVIGVKFNFDRAWSFYYSMYLGMQFNYWGSLGIALFYIGLVMLICKAINQNKIMNAFAATGRMALSNYLLQTVICTTIFYGHGFGLFGQVERVYQVLIVIGIWVFQLNISPWWLTYFKFGPVEWLWRSLTYLKAQPFRRVLG